MPSLTAYGNLQLDDDDGIQVWLLAHNMRHKTYDYAMSQKGYTVTAYDFSQYPDDTWYQNHSSKHEFLQAIAVPDQTASPTILQTLTWDSQEDFDAWMQQHTLLHTRIDEALSIFS